MTDRKLKAAEQVARKKLTAQQIADETGVSRRTIETWKKEKEFQGAVKAARNDWRAKAKTAGIADPDFRLRARNDRHKRLMAVMNAWGASDAMKDVPGGRTGLVRVTYKMRSLGEGLGSEQTPEYFIDKDALDSMLELEEHEAIETGAWKAKVEHSGSVDINDLMDRINAGRKLVADEKVARDLAAKKALESAAPL